MGLFHPQNFGWCHFELLKFGEFVLLDLSGYCSAFRKVKVNSVPRIWTSFCLYLMPLKHEVLSLFHLMQHNWQSKEQIGFPGPCTAERLELAMLCGLAWALLLRPRNSCPGRCCGAGSWTVHQQDKQSLCYQAAPVLSTEGLQGGFTIIIHIFIKPARECCVCKWSNNLISLKSRQLESSGPCTLFCSSCSSLSLELPLSAVFKQQLLFLRLLPPRQSGIWSSVP